ncbi:short transient receptor potential channel 4-associated protein-like isoform X2 [Dermacentor silvarum]|uniref:short transient receptor potential channel 4-associated protein-like isoform X2 n=1 Tax=Dermacentor silvarum TaxID=543639 RepID=UPI00189B1458|nr:short transient receptor potential channel 4-associated protein-like isoform X2 [Dermacentor silvarum]
MSCLRYMQRRARARGFNAAPYFTLQREICEQNMVIASKPPEQMLVIIQPELVTSELGPLYLRLQTLDRLSVAFCPDEQLYQEALRILLALQQKLQYQSHLGSSLDIVDGSDQSRPAAVMKLLVQLNGIEILLRIIMQYSLLPRETAVKHVNNSRYLILQSHCVEVLHRLCVDDTNVARELSHKEALFQGLLSLLQFSETCLVACDLIECLLLSRREVLNLTTIPNITSLIANMNDIQLANFCKVLAISLSDLDVYEHKTSLYAQCKEKNRNNFSCVRDINQEVILNVPGILKRLVMIACAKPWISQWNRESSRFQHEAALKISAEMTFRAEAVYILGLLLVGKRRKEVQRALASLRLIPQLSDLFDHFVWKYNTMRGQDRGRLPGHNINCECSPEVALKIQVLRLVHSFCEHAEYKHVMLSWSEYSELKRNELARSVESPSLDRNLMCTGSKGLLTKIVEVLKKEAGSSTFRFWLSRAIESYLRGCTSSADQDFLLSRGLLQLVAGNLVNCNVRQKEVLQSSFDLLGELVKFNLRAFRQLDKILSTEAKQRKLLTLVNGYLVDSNMFVRSLVLSQEHLSVSDDYEAREYAERSSYVLSHIGDQRNRIRYLKKLVSLVTISNLTQENVSCVNTALVLLIFAQQRGQLVSYLHALRGPPPPGAASKTACNASAPASVPAGSTAATATASSGSLLQNLLELLHFWQEHYLHKDKDCSALEKSSRIGFHRWKAMVNTLVSEDITSPVSLVYHVHPGPSTRDS